MSTPATTTIATPFDAAIEEVRAKLQELTSALSTLLGLQAGYLTAPASNPAAMRVGAESEVQHDSFFGMTIGDAAKKYLTMAKVTKSTADIATALEHGGMKHTSKDFATTVRSILGPREDFIRVPNGDWGLSEWYPGQGRGRKPKAEKQTRTKKRRTKKSRGPRLEDRIVDAMKSDSDRDWTSNQLVTALDGTQRESIQSTLSRMAKDGTRVKKADKGYRLAG